MRLPFPARFALVLVVLGGLIAGVTVVVPLRQAQTQRRQGALDRTVDRQSLALDLVRAEEASLQAYASAAARQLPSAAGQRAAFLDRVSEAAQAQDLVALVGSGEVQVSRSGGVDGSATDASSVRAASRSRDALTADAAGRPWLLGRAAVVGGAAVLVLRPLGAGVLSAVTADVGAVSGAGIAVVRNGAMAIDGSVAGRQLRAGEPLPQDLLGGGVAAGTEVVGQGSSDIAVAAAALGGGFTLVATSSVEGGLWSSITLPVLLTAAALILLSLVIVFAIVQRDLQRPLARLDRAVAALADENFDHPVPSGGDDSVGRLGERFEAMRRELAGTLRTTEARAAIATDLSSLTPLSAALQAVCLRLHRATGAAAALIVVHDEEGEELCSAGIEDPPPPGRLLRGDGPVAAAARLGGYSPLVACALPASTDADVGLREICAAPLRVGTREHGAIALADRIGGFGRHEQELLAAAAEQVSIAIERDRVLSAARLQASTDPLTGLNNRRFLRAYLEQQVAVSDRSRTPFSLLLIDVDEFKEINDSLGHEVGDTALVSVARTIEHTVRRSDLAARYGGDEFVVVMSETTSHDAELVAEKLRAAVAEVRVGVYGQGARRLTVSIGVSARAPRGIEVDRLLLLADNALYEAKRAGRDRVRVAEDADASRGDEAVSAG